MTSPKTLVTLENHLLQGTMSNNFEVLLTASLAVNGVSLLRCLLALKHTFALPVRLFLMWPTSLCVCQKGYA